MEMLFLFCMASAVIISIVMIFSHCVGIDFLSSWDEIMDRDIGNSWICYPIIGLFLSGLSGYIASHVFNLHVAAIVIAIVSGIGSVLLFRHLISLLQNYSKNRKMLADDTIGCTGYVYVTLPGKYQSGKVMVSVHDRLYEYEAQSRHRIDAGLPILVTGAASASIVIVDEQ